MHELALAENIAQIIQQNLPAPDAVVSKIHLKVGKLSGVVPEALRAGFQIVAQKTASAQAALEIEEVPARAKCADCQAEFTITEPYFLCPGCSSGRIQLTAGQELTVESFDVEDQR
jgi:hydrogenase nickel incorporation protein HypA/HybF